jgi:hypothetical protein
VHGFELRVREAAANEQGHAVACVVQEVSSWPSEAISSRGGGGMKAPSRSVLPRPPIQFCEVRISKANSAS